MNELRIFNNPEFGEIRAIEIDGEPWLVGKDAAAALGYKDTVNALKAHVEDDDKMGWQITTQLGERTVTVINESGVYSLVFSSKLDRAKEFKHWVTHDVLPAIRKAGGYIAATTDMTDAEIMARALLVANDTIKRRDERIKALEAQSEFDRPKVLFADSVSASKHSILIGEMAKILKQNGVENMGQNRLFEWLRQNGYLIRRIGTDYNMPTQKSMELGLFEIKETAITHPDGHTTVSKTPNVTGKGQMYFVDKFLATD